MDLVASNNRFKYDALPNATFSNPCWEDSLRRGSISMFDGHDCSSLKFFSFDLIIRVCILKLKLITQNAHWEI